MSENRVDESKIDEEKVKKIIEFAYHQIKLKGNQTKGTINSKIVEEMKEELKWKLKALKLLTSDNIEMFL